MDLILWRHAEAEYSTPDLARELTGKGHKQAKQMAAWLKTRLPENTRILVSPARRTQQTAAALGLDFTTLDSIAPGTSAQDLIEVLNWPQAHESVLIVGHQPTLGEVASLLLTGQEQSWSVKKGAIWWLTHRSRDSTSQCLLRAVIAPDML